MELSLTSSTLAARALLVGGGHAAVDVEIDGAALAIDLHQRTRVRELPSEDKARHLAGRLGAAGDAPDAAHILDAVAREVEEYHVLHLPGYRGGEASEVRHRGIGG